MKKFNLAGIKKLKYGEYIIDFTVLSIYILLAIRQYFKDNYDAMAAFIVVCVFYILVIINRHIIRNNHKIIKKQQELIDNLLNFFLDQNNNEGAK